MTKNITDNEIWDPEKHFQYLADCSKSNGLTTAKALSEAAGVDQSFISRFKNGDLKNPPFVPVVRLYMAAGASIDYAYDIESPYMVRAEEYGRMVDQLQAAIESKEAQQHEIEKMRLELADKAQILAEKDRLLEDREKALDHERHESKRKTRHISVLTVVLVALIIVVSGICIYDRLNPNVGWFRMWFSDQNTDASAGDHDLYNSLQW